MNTNHVQEQLLAYLCGELDRHQEQIVRDHVAQCEQCRNEMNTVSAFWNSLSLLPQEQPSDAMRERFYDSLQDAIEETMKRAPSPARRAPNPGWFERFFPRPFTAQFGMALLLLVVGGYAGSWFSRTNEQAAQPAQATQVDRSELQQLHKEVLAMNRLLAVSLLQQQSASERLKGVSLSYRVEGSDPEITAALLQALKYDPNVNVRLAALDALTEENGQSLVRNELIKSLPKQDSPLVQIEIIDWIVNAQEKSSLDVLKKMLKTPGVNKAVKQRLEEGILELNS